MASATYNRVILMGNITKDLELKTIPNGKYFLSFTIAVNTYSMKQMFTDFFDCKAFDRVAGAIGHHLKKGSPILIEGNLRNDRWESDGRKMQKTVIYVEKAVFAENLCGEENQEAMVPTFTQDRPSFEDIPPEEDLPF